MNDKKLTIGLFGFGVVGEGFAQSVKANTFTKSYNKKSLYKNADKKKKCAS